MRKRIGQRILSIILSLSLLAGMMPLQAAAAEGKPVAGNYVDVLRMSFLEGDKLVAAAYGEDALSKDTFLLEDKFVLTYLRGDMKAAQGQIALLLDKCCLEAPVMAMVFDCLLSQNLVCDANSALERRIEELHDYDYNVNSEIHRLQKAFSRESYRKRLIASYRYNHSIIFQYCYLE